VSATAATDTYDIPQDLRDFRDLVRRISVEQVEPRAAQIDSSDEYPWDLRRLLAEQDILALPFTEEHGGTGTGTLMQQMAVEELAKSSAAVALILMIQELGTLPISLYGSDELKARFLPRCASGEWSPAFCRSPTPAATRPPCARARAGTAMTGSSTARRTGSPTPASPTSTSSSPSPTATTAA
jgi:alkylation response protein AidB-like acyl-CoA dehydrogenase